jgi:hypothetical protein
MRLVRCHAIIITMSELVNNTRLHVGNKAPSVGAGKYHTQYLRYLAMEYLTYSVVSVVSVWHRYFISVYATLSLLRDIYNFIQSCISNLLCLISIS